CPEAIGFSKLDQSGDGDPGPAPEVVDRKIGLIFPAGDQSRGFSIPQTLDHAQAKPDGEVALVTGRLERAIPMGEIDANGPDLDAMLPSVAHDLGRGIESHGLRIERGAAERVGMPAFHPTAGI